MKRCDWCEGDDLYVSYHDDEWGVPTRDTQTLFEFLLLEGAQAGLSWITVLRKRENYRSAFDDFDPVKIAAYDKRKKGRLLRDEGIIRNRLKIDSAIKNAQAFLDLEATTAGFSDYLWGFVDGQPIQNSWQERHQVPATSKISDAMAKDLKKKGFSFVGSTICYAFMQATGMVNDHLLDCHRYAACAERGKHLAD